MTTLADLMVARSVTSVTEQHLEGASMLQSEMRDAVKFVVRPDVEEIVTGIMKEVSRAEMPWPMPVLENTWIETRAPGDTVRVGLFLRRENFGFLLMTDLSEDRWQVVPIIHDLEKQEVTIEYMQSLAKVKSREAVGEVVDRLLLMLHLIQQPRIVDKPLREHNEKLQKARRKSGKEPLLSYHEVTVHVTRRERAAAAAAQDTERRTGKRLHHVRAFYRVKLGKIERVCAHWRGSAELGVSLASGHRVSR